MNNLNIDKGRRHLLPPALYFPEYRNFWMGMFGAVCGFQVLMFGQFWLMHELTRSPLYLGYVGMAFFNSFFGLAYVSLMPVFSREILQIGADGQGVLLSLNGTCALIMTLVIGLRANLCGKASVLIGGAALFGLSIISFALSAEYIGSYLLAGIFMFAMGIFSSTYMISVLSSLQMMVPDYMRGRLMGIYGITWNIMPLGGLYAGFLAGFIGTPFAVAIGGFLVMAFALGPAVFNKQIRNLGGRIAQSA
jgi:MFS family permease